MLPHPLANDDPIGGGLVERWDTHDPLLREAKSPKGVLLKGPIYFVIRLLEVEDYEMVPIVMYPLCCLWEWEDIVQDALRSSTKLVCVSWIMSGERSRTRTLIISVWKIAFLGHFSVHFCITKLHQVLKRSGRLHGQSWKTSTRPRIRWESRIWRSMTAIGITITSEDLARRCIRILPPKYHSLVTALNTQNRNVPLNFEVSSAMLLEEEMHQKMRNGGEDSTF